MRGKATRPSPLVPRLFQALVFSDDLRAEQWQCGRDQRSHEQREAEEVRT